MIVLYYGRGALAELALIKRENYFIFFIRKNKYLLSMDEMDDETSKDD